MSKRDFNEALRQVAGRNVTISPQFMGKKGATNAEKIEEVRRFIKKQKRIKGFKFSIPQGGDSFNLNLAGTARLLLGYVLLPPDPDDIPSMPESHTFTVNNEIVVDTVHPDFFSGRFMDDEFVFIPRPLSGTDEIKIGFENSQAAQDWQLALYYI